jgi:putative FmdB family regulatory protein
MALYEFQCARCGRRTEVIQRFSDPAPAECPHCGGALTKLLSSPAFQFKGSGFYATDYGRSGAKPEDASKEKEGDSSKGKEGGGGGPSEAGAATKGDSGGDSSKEKKDSGTGTVSDGGAAKASPESSSPSKKNTKRK